MLPVGKSKLENPHSSRRVSVYTGAGGMSTCCHKDACLSLVWLHISPSAFVVARYSCTSTYTCIYLQTLICVPNRQDTSHAAICVQGVTAYACWASPFLTTIRGGTCHRLVRCAYATATQTGPQEGGTRKLDGGTSPRVVVILDGQIATNKCEKWPCVES